MGVVSHNGKVVIATNGKALTVPFGATTAEEVAIVDAGNYYSSDNVEGALQEVGADIDTLMTTAPIIPVKSKDEMTDHTKDYLLNGHIWRWETRTVERTIIVPAKATVVKGYRWSQSGGHFSAEAGTSCLIVPLVAPNSTSDNVVLTDGNGAINFYSVRTNAYFGTANNGSFSQTAIIDKTPSGSTADTATVHNLKPIGDVNKIYLIIFTSGTSDYTSADLKINGVSMALEVVTTLDDTTTPTNIGAAHASSTTITEEVSDFYDTEIVYGAGKSAYQIAVEHGFVGTEEEWLESLRIPANIVQTTGTSETAVMSQKAVTDAISNFKAGGIGENIGNVVAPKQKPADGSTEADVDLSTCTVADVEALLSTDLTRYPNYIFREYLGKNSANSTINEYDMYRYVLSKYSYSAWVKDTHPKMYAWKNGNTLIYSKCVSPRIGDTMYSTAYIGTSAGTVSEMSAQNSTRTVNGTVYTRSKADDVMPTVLYHPIYEYYAGRFYDMVDGQLDFEHPHTRTSMTDTTAVIGGANYTRCPMYDLDSEQKRKIPITIFASEHGETDPRDCFLITVRLIKDLCENNAPQNPVLSWLKENACLSIIPCVNPYGWNKKTYVNARSVNINRNYDTPGWDIYKEQHPGESATSLGAYAGSENETQYVMNTICDSDAKIAISIHGLNTAVINYCAYQGQNPNGDYDENKILKIRELMYETYGLTLKPYDPADAPPASTAKAPSFITYAGAYGGICELCYSDIAGYSPTASERTLIKNTAWTMEQQYTQLLNFVAMWVSDFEDSIT